MNAIACGPALDWVVHCDGSAVPNPGRMGMGAVVSGPDGQRHTLSQASAGHGCNNEAELLALMAALRIAQQQGAMALQIYSDSSILVEQLGPAHGKPIERLADLFDEARSLMQSFERVQLTWLPRHRNGAADALARAALGLLPKPAPKWKKRRR